MISSATDIKIFIEHNKSTNLNVPKERFEDFEQTAEEKNLALSAAAASVSNNAFIIDDNYMAKSGTSRLNKEEKKGSSRLTKILNDGGSASQQPISDRSN